MADHSDLIGVPFELGARGPHAYDCYGLLREVIRREQGVEIPDYESPKDAANIIALFAVGVSMWKECGREAGAAALIALPKTPACPTGSMHCGYLVNDHQILHTSRRLGGAVIEPIEHWARRIKGFYRYVGT